jgi:hypothetical protein
MLWTKKQSAFPGKTPEDLKKLLGHVPPVKGIRYETVEKEIGLPDKVDWRTTPTRVTPIKSQGDCGSCVCMATVAQIESMVEIAKNSNSPVPDLSESDLMSHGGSCNGWDIARSYPAAVKYGICDEKCWPYLGEGPCPDRANRLTKVISYITTKAPKEALQKGPIVSACAWYYDWFNYESGIIDDIGDGNVVGYHALCIVGYNDPGQYWIVRNSWSENWGESGNYRIKYSTAAEAGFGTAFAWYQGYVGNLDPDPNPTPVPTDKTYTAKTLSKPTGAYEFGISKPESKVIMTTKAYGSAVPFGQFPVDQKFEFYLKSGNEVFNSEDKTHCKQILTSYGLWLNWMGIGKFKNKMIDAIIEIRKG